MKKRLKGFTLMELLVVIAIIAVLAGALIPSMNYFIRQSKLKTANAQAKVVFNAALTVSQEYESKNMTVMVISDGDPNDDTTTNGNTQDFTNILYEPSPIKYDGVQYAKDTIVIDLITRVNNKVMETPESDSDVWAVRYENKGGKFPVLTGAVYASTEQDRYVGCYPNNTPTTDLTGGYANILTRGYASWLSYAVDGTVAW